MITESYRIRNKYNTSDLIRFSAVTIRVKEKVWLTEHHHTELELGLYLSGSGSYTAGGRELTFAPGDILLFGSNQEHIINQINLDEDIRLFNLHFDPRILWGSSLQSFSHSSLRGFISSLAQHAGHISPGQEYYDAIRRLLRDIENEFRECLPEYELAIEGRILDILIKLVRSHGPQAVPPSGHGINYEHLACVEKVTDYILSNLSEPLTLDSLARQANTSRSYLCSLFKEINGLPIWEYITIKRIDLAIQYLRETQEPVTCIGELCGFNTSANFNRAFRKITQQSPSEFRKNSGNYY